MGSPEGSVALDPEGVRAIAQGNTLCHSGSLSSISPEGAKANNVTIGFRPFRDFGGNYMRHRALPCAIAPTLKGSGVTFTVAPMEKHLISFKFKQALIVFLYYYTFICIRKVKRV
jgi:hypothetical protein